MLADSLCAGNALFKGDAESCAQTLSYSLGFCHHCGGQLSAQRKLAYVDKRRMGQGTDGIERQVAPKFEPDLGAYVVENP